MADRTVEILLNYAARFSDHAAGQTAVDYAKERGWIDDEGKATTSGKDAAKAFDDQSKTRSSLRIG